MRTQMDKTKVMENNTKLAQFCGPECVSKIKIGKI